MMVSASPSRAANSAASTAPEPSVSKMPEERAQRVLRNGKSGWLNEGEQSRLAAENRELSRPSLPRCRISADPDRFSPANHSSA